MADNPRDDGEAMEPLVEANEQAQDIAPPAAINPSDNLLKDWEPGSTFKSIRGRVPYEGGSNVTVSRAPCTKHLEHSFY